VRTYAESGWHTWHLNRATKGLYVPPMEWRCLTNFSSNAVALVLASTTYDPTDYIWDPAELDASLPMPEEDYFTRRSKAAMTGGMAALVNER
jgi:hypothetical protein